MAFLLRSIFPCRKFVTILFITLTLSSTYLILLPWSTPSPSTYHIMSLVKRMHSMPTPARNASSLYILSQPNPLNNELYRNISTYFHISQSEYHDPLLNLHQFKYLINSDKCIQNLFVLAFVHSAPLKLKERNQIRLTWGGYKVFKGKLFRTVFMLANPHNTTVQRAIEEEAMDYGDIVQGDFNDTYKNLTYKHIMGLLWTTQNCPNVSYILKTDDDIIVNVYNMLEYLNVKKPDMNFLYCSVFHKQRPYRFGKWKVSKSEYPFHPYPFYCQGFAYIMTSDVAVKLIHASKEVKMLWIDDVYVTGILNVMASVHFSSMEKNSSYCAMTETNMGPSVKNNMFIISRNRDMRKRWNKYWRDIVTYSK